MQTIKQSILSIVIGLALVAGISYAEWKGAQGNPPTLNAPAPINVGLSNQTIGDSTLASQNKNLSMGNGQGVLGLGGSMNINGSLNVSGVSIFKGGTNKDDFTSFLPNADGKNYLRGTTILADGGIRSGTNNNNTDRLQNRVGVGTADPKAKLDIQTNDPLDGEWALRIKKGTVAVPAGYVLTSFTDGVDGLASWAALPPPPPDRFGGMYFERSDNRNCIAGNPFAGGGCACPPGFSSVLAVYGITGSSNNIYISWCYK